MSKKHVLIKGTIILTLAGFITRFIGFFYRIFLSKTIGAEGMGIYQLIFPIYGMCFSITAAGIQTAISRFVAAKVSLKEERNARDIFFTGLVISLFLSVIVSLLLYHNADLISIFILEEERCAELLRIIAFTIPCGAVHCCISGYYYGLKKAHVPAASQLIEQIIRVCTSYIVFLIMRDNGQAATPVIAAIGIVAGEFFSMLFAGTVITGSFCGHPLKQKRLIPYTTHARKILSLSVPLTANRILLNILQSTESILIPIKLRLYGYDTSEALSVYGVMSGMSLPLILFPSAITNSVAVMLLPTIAEAQAAGDKKVIARTVENTIKYCLILGILCTGIFLSFGDEVGTLLFDSAMAGQFILILAWICPFLYLSTTLTSVLNGLGKTASSFIHNCIGLGIRIFFVFFLVPRYGIVAYLWGLLVSELVITFLCVHDMNKYMKLYFPFDSWILKPCISLAAAMGGAILLQNAFLNVFSAPPLIAAAFAFFCLCITYCVFLFLFKILKIPVDK